MKYAAFKVLPLLAIVIVFITGCNHKAPDTNDTETTRSRATETQAPGTDETEGVQTDQSEQLSGTAEVVLTGSQTNRISRVSGTIPKDGSAVESTADSGTTSAPASGKTSSGSDSPITTTATATATTAYEGIAGVLTPDQPGAFTPDV